MPVSAFLLGKWVIDGQVTILVVVILFRQGKICFTNMIYERGYVQDINKLQFKAKYNFILNTQQFFLSNSMANA